MSVVIMDERLSFLSAWRAPGSDCTASARLESNLNHRVDLSIVQERKLKLGRFLTDSDWKVGQLDCSNDQIGASNRNHEPQSN